MKICNISYITEITQATIDLEDVVDVLCQVEGEGSMEVIAMQSELYLALQVLLLISVSVVLLSPMLWWLLPDRRQNCKLL